MIVFFNNACKQLFANMRYHNDRNTVIYNLQLKSRIKLGEDVYGCRNVAKFDKNYFHSIKIYFHSIKIFLCDKNIFSFDKIYCHSMEYFHRVKIFSFDKKYIFNPECHVVLVRPGRIGPIRAKNGWSAHQVSTI